MARIEMNGVLHLRIGKDLMSSRRARYPPGPTTLSIQLAVWVSILNRAAAGLAVPVKPALGVSRAILPKRLTAVTVACRTRPILRCR